MRGSRSKVTSAAATRSSPSADEWDPRRYDEIVVSTLPQMVSKWLHAGLPERIERITGARVTHVVSAAAQAGGRGRPGARCTRSTA